MVAYCYMVHSIPGTYRVVALSPRDAQWFSVETKNYPSLKQDENFLWFEIITDEI